jgi:hypothetical protein
MKSHCLCLSQRRVTVHVRYTSHAVILTLLSLIPTPPRLSCPFITAPFFVCKHKKPQYKGGQESYCASPIIVSSSVLRASAKFLISCLPFSTLARTHPRAKEHVTISPGNNIAFTLSVGQSALRTNPSRESHTDAPAPTDSETTLSHDNRPESSTATLGVDDDVPELQVPTYPVMTPLHDNELGSPPQHLPLPMPPLRPLSLTLMLQVLYTQVCMAMSRAKIIQVRWNCPLRCPSRVHQTVQISLRVAEICCGSTCRSSL